METKRQAAIFNIILENEPIGISAILEKLNGQISVPTLNRELAALKAGNFILAEGRGPGIKYIVPFEDGNKRTARLTGNALLMFAGMYPLSYRSVSPAEYKKAILLFYELNNINAFKKIFISQYQFAVENYF